MKTAGQSSISEYRPAKKRSGSSLQCRSLSSHRRPAFSQVDVDAEQVSAAAAAVSPEDVVVVPHVPRSRPAPPRRRCRPGVNGNEAVDGRRPEEPVQSAKTAALVVIVSSPSSLPSSPSSVSANGGVVALSLKARPPYKQPDGSKRQSTEAPKRRRSTAACSTAAQTPSCPRSERQQLALLRRTQQQEACSSSPTYYCPPSPANVSIDRLLPLSPSSASSSSSARSLTPVAVPLSPLASSAAAPGAAPTTRRRRNLARTSRRNDCGETLLHIAARKGNTRRCQELLEEGADVNAVDYASWTPLHEACNQGQYETAKLLIDHHADVCAKGLDNDTPLHDAVRSGNTQLIQLLLVRGANPLQENIFKVKPVDLCEDAELRQLLGVSHSLTNKEQFSSGGGMSQDLSESATSSSTAAASAGVLQHNARDDHSVVTRFADSAGPTTTATEKTAVSQGLLLQMPPPPPPPPAPPPPRPVSLSVEADSQAGSARAIEVVPEFAAERPEAVAAALSVSSGETSELNILLHSSSSTVLSSGDKNTGAASPGQIPGCASGSVSSGPETRRSGPHTRRYLKRSRQQQQQEPLTNTTTSHHGMKRRLGRRGTVRKSNASARSTAAVDVYEFHASDSEDESSLTHISPSYRCKAKSAANSSNQPHNQKVEVLTTSSRSSPPATPEEEEGTLADARSGKSGVTVEPVLEVDTDLSPFAVSTILTTCSSPSSELPLPTAATFSSTLVTTVPLTTMPTDAGGDRKEQSSCNGTETPAPASSFNAMPLKHRLLTSYCKENNQLSALIFSLKSMSCETTAESGAVTQTAADSNEIVEATVVTVSSASATGKSVDESDTLVLGAETRSGRCSRSLHLSESASKLTDVVDGKTVSPKVPPLKLILSNPGRRSSDDEPGKDGNRTYVVRSENHSPEEPKEDMAHCHKTDDAAKRNLTHPAPVESSHRITRSQVRLHGAPPEYIKSLEEADEIAMHPRRKKLRSKPLEVVDAPMDHVLAEKYTMIAAMNPFEAIQELRKNVREKWIAARKGNASTLTQRLIKEHSFKMAPGNHLCKNNEHLMQSKLLPVPEDLTGRWAELFRSMEEERHRLRLSHQIQKERLIMACESEALRTYDRMQKASSIPAFSVMRFIRDSDIYNPQQLVRAVPFSLVANQEGQKNTDSSLSIEDVLKKFSKRKQEMISHQLCEAQCMYAMQLESWINKMKQWEGGLTLATANGKPSRYHVYMVAVVDDFELLPNSFLAVTGTTQTKAT